jgi:hypothetical protein
MSKYRKPTILFQPMALAANITASCSNGIDHSDPGTCSATDPVDGSNIFTTYCEVVMEPDWDFDKNDGICYHVPTLSSNIYMS